MCHQQAIGDTMIDKMINNIKVNMRNPCTAASL